jgi:hypothetical protein
MSPAIPDAPTASSAANDLRRAFDAAFAAAPAERAAEPEPFLLVKLAGNAHAIRIREIQGFAAARTVVPLSSPVPELLGLAGFRGSLLPVYDLASLLGYPERDAQPRWFILCGDVEPVAFAFSEFDGYHEQPRADRHVLRQDGTTRAIVDVARLIASVRTKVGLGPAASTPTLGPDTEPSTNPREPT